MSSHPALKLLSSYLDDEVTAAQLRLVERHLDECTECRGTVAGLRAVAQGVRRLEAVAPPATLAAAVEQRVRRVSLQETSASRLEENLKRWMAQPVLAPLFAIVLALGAILYLFAFGVARDEARGTRFVVAAAPSEEKARSADRAPGARRAAAAQGEPSAEEVMVSPAPSSASRQDPAEESLIALGSPGDSKVGEAVEDEATEERAAPGRAQAPEIDAAGREVARSRATGTVSAAPLLELRPSAPAAEPADFRDIAGRRFYLDGETWVEIGLEGEAAVEILDVRSESSELDPELEPFRELGRVRIRLGDRVVELLISDAEPRE